MTASTQRRTWPPDIPSRRVTLECPVQQPSALVDGLSGSVPSDLAPSGDLHLTMFHVGRLNDIYDAVAAARRAGETSRPLSPSTFLSALANWLAESARSVPRPELVSGRELRSLGGAPYVVVLVLDQLGPALSELHDKFVLSFAHFLEADLGVPDGSALLRSADAFGFSGKSWLPHVTLGTRAEPWETNLEPVKFMVDSMKVRNMDAVLATFRGTADA